MIIQVGKAAEQTCGRCVVMDKEIECICCQEIAFLSRVVEGESISFTWI